MKSHQIRESFLRFFEERGHRRMPSAPLVPAGDPSLLFTSAGMVQFKPYFLGQATPPQPRLTTVQKCFRTSDIDSVGDASHLTFFEMLGNFSVGDYFKAEAIPWAWEYVTSMLGLDPDRLWAAVYLDDDEAFDLWYQVGLPAERIRRYGEEHNYWFSGEVGPCGPCSELHYDFGPQFGCGPACEPDHEGCDRFLEIWNLVFMTYFQHPSTGSGQAPDGSRTPLPAKNIDTGAGLERMAAATLYQSDGWDKRKHPSVYDTDLFQPIIRRIEELSGKRYGQDPQTDRAMRIVAEHARAVTFLIGDERTPVVPSNEERGYAVRRVLRRAVYFGRRYLGLEQPFLTDVAETVTQHMSGAYPEVERQRKFVLEIVGPEEQRFEETLSRGDNLLSGELMPVHQRAVATINGWLNVVSNAADTGLEPWTIEEESARCYRELLQLTMTGPVGPGMVEWERVPHWLVSHTLDPAIEEFGRLTGERDLDESHIKESFERITGLVSRLATTLTGEEAFVLHDTYGFPLELTREIARERGFTVDEEGFERLMEEQRERSRAAIRGTATVSLPRLGMTAKGTVFMGYESLETTTKVSALLVDGQQTDAVGAVREPPLQAEVILPETPFYPEGGGQVGDRGEIIGPNGRVAVEDTQRVAERLVVHRGRLVQGRLAVGDAVLAQVDPQHRADTMRNHTATHLLHAALRRLLGSHVRQSGSLVAPDHLRFDFTHTEALTAEQIGEVQRLVNDKVRENLPVQSRLTTFDQAMAEGVLAFFGEKYGEEVRVVEVNSVVPKPVRRGGPQGPPFSAELCGGTHCQRTGDIGFFVITGESSIGAGMRRVEALSGRGAEEYVRAQQAALDDIARRLGAPREVVTAKAESLLAELDAQRKKVERLERSLASAPATNQLLQKAIDVDGVRVLATEVEAPSLDALRYVGDAVRKALSSGVALLGSVIDGRPQFVAIVTRDLTQRGLHAGALLGRVAAVAGGGGGGRPEMAQGGGKDPSKLEDALAIVPAAVREMLSGRGESKR